MEMCASDKINPVESGFNYRSSWQSMPECGALLPLTTETLNQIIDQIHFQLLQSTEAHRLLRRELALSTFGFLSVCFRNT